MCTRTSACRASIRRRSRCIPWSNGTCATEPEPGGESLTLDCASGFGTATFVTGAFGFAAAGEVVRRIALSG